MRLTGCKQGELNVLAWPFFGGLTFFLESGACTNKLSLRLGQAAFAALSKS
jgi:hypothetical protein